MSYQYFRGQVRSNYEVDQILEAEKQEAMAVVRQNEIDAHIAAGKTEAEAILLVDGPGFYEAVTTHTDEIVIIHTPAEEAPAEEAPAEETPVVETPKAEEVQAGEVSCAECGVKFSSERGLKKHISARHSQPK